jgi:alkylated DNA repair protein (DNA oxidative demethylase)
MRRMTTIPPTPGTLPLEFAAASDEATDSPSTVELQPGLRLLRAFVDAKALHEAVSAVVAAAPLRHFVTPGGKPMAAAMTNCGALGWTSDRTGYRYSPVDPDTGAPWPALPGIVSDLASRAARAAGFDAFRPDACLVNRYAPGAGMTAHQDRDERDFTAPIVSVSLGLAATFFWHAGPGRRSPSRSVRLESGDVLVFGGPSRLMYHGVRPPRAGVDPTFGAFRWNLTLRRAG